MRKILFAAVAAALCSSVLTACGGESGSDDDKLVIVTSGGEFEKALDKSFVKAFEKETGIEIVMVSAAYDAQFTSLKQQSNAKQVEYDIISTTPSTTAQYSELMADMDCDRLDNLDMATENACTEKGLLRSFGAGLLTYNKDAFGGKEPTSWKDFWDTKNFPGPRAMSNAGQVEWNIAAALLADGVQPDDLYPLDLDRAFKKLDEIKPEIRTYWSSGDQSQAILRDKEVVMSLMWSGRALATRDSGAPVGVVWNESMLDAASWGIAKDAPNADAAYKFLDFFLSRPKAHIEFSKAIKYSTSNAAAAAELPKDIADDYAANHLDEILDVSGNTDVASQRADIVAAWNEWVSK